MNISFKKHIEDDLVHKISLGDKKAFEELYYLYYKRLCQFAYLFLPSKELCEEAVSDVFLKVWVNRAQLDPQRNVRQLLYTSVRNLAINYSQREETSSLRDNINIYEIEIQSPEPYVDEIIEREQIHELLQRAFDELPERCLMIARMHFNDQLQYKEIADILNIARKTVEAQIAIATRKLKEIFEKYGWNKIF